MRQPNDIVIYEPDLIIPSLLDFKTTIDKRLDIIKLRQQTWETVSKVK